MTLAEAAARVERVYGVPGDLALAVAYVDTRLTLVSSRALPSGDARAGEGGHTTSMVGFGLRPWLRSFHPVAYAASQLGVGDDSLERDPGLALLATGAVLAELARRRGVIEQLSDWAEALGDYAGLVPALARRDYAEQIFDVLRAGLTQTTSWGERVVIVPQSVAPPRLPFPNAALAAGKADRAIDAVGTPQAVHPSNHSSGRAGQTISRIILHTVQGSYAGAIGWFADPRANVSAHYVVRSSDGQITQVLDEKHAAWHAGNRAYNRTSIGIEHEGYVGQPERWYTDAMLRASAALVGRLCRRYSIPVDRAHIIQHSDVPDPRHPGRFGGVGNHTDMGPGFDMARFLTLVREGDTPASVDTEAIDITWARTGPSAFRFTARVDPPVERILFKVDGWTIGSVDRSGEGFQLAYRFHQTGLARKVEAVGFDGAGKRIASGIGAVDVTDDEGVFIRQAGARTYEIGLEGARAEVAAIEVSADGFVLPDALTGQTRTPRLAVRSAFLTLGARTFDVRTYDGRGALLRTYQRSFTLR